jgi:pyrroline-5-carboxylate reductase
MLLNTDFDPRTLEIAVTSPKGTTERAMAVFTERNLTKTVSDAMDACLARADELSGN